MASLTNKATYDALIASGVDDGLGSPMNRAFCNALDCVDEKTLRPIYDGEAAEEDFYAMVLAGYAAAG